MQGEAQRNTAGLTQSRKLMSYTSPQVPAVTGRGPTRTYGPFGIPSLIPPPTDTPSIMQRVDEVNTLYRTLLSSETSSVILSGSPGAGKSTLAALLYRRLQVEQSTGGVAPRYLVWLSVGHYTAIPDLLAAIIEQLGIHDSTFPFRTADQQIQMLLQVLRRPQENALVVLDQCEHLLQPENNLGLSGRGPVALFLEALQANIGGSRFLLTSYTSPFEQEQMEGGSPRVRSVLVTRITLPEGVSLMQKLDLQESQEELAVVWQRCGGHVQSLTLFSVLARLSGISLSYFLNAPDYQPMWSGDVVFNLMTAICHFLNPVQYAILRALSLFQEPAPLEAIIALAAGKMAHHEETRQRLQVELQALIQLDLSGYENDLEGNPLFTLHSIVRHYILEHYLEGAEQPIADTSELGGDEQKAQETIQIALAAGHRQIAVYYERYALTNVPARSKRQQIQEINPLLLAIRHYCLGGHWQEAYNLVRKEKLHDSLVKWGSWNSLINIYTALLPPLGILLRKDEGMVAGLLAMLYGRLGDFQQCQHYFGQALMIQRQIGDLEGEATTLVNQGELLRQVQEYDQARQSFEYGLLLSEKSQNLGLKCVLLHNLGLLYHAMQQYQEALEYYRQALRLTEFKRNRPHLGLILTNLGMLLYEQGLEKEGLTLLLAAQKQRQAQQDPTVLKLDQFLSILEKRMGSPAYQQLCQEALQIQQSVLAHFIA